jgi:hypothetical protein
MDISSSSWQAAFEDGTLHISGTAKYPNSFSVAGLERVITQTREPGVLTYRVAFYRDKEPYCDSDLIGPVHHFERHLPAGIVRIRVLFDGGQVEIPVPKV